MASATAELEAAIAALPAKKQRLRESFDRLVANANAPVPIPFTWDDINTHISSLQSSIALRFFKLQCLQAAAPTTTTDPVEHPGNEDRKPYPEHRVRGDDEEGEERANWACEEDGDHGTAEAMEASPVLELLEFHAHEILNHLGNIPRNKKQSCIDLCTCLGLIHTMADSVNQLIENGQELDAIRLACVLNLTDKYTPLSIMNEYVDKAKKTAQEILSMESDSPEPLNQAMTKQVNALILSWRAVDEYSIESVHRNSIKAEITRLLHEYANKRQSLSDASSPALDEEQQEQCQQELEMLEEQLREKQKTEAQELQPKSEKEQQQQQQLKQQEAPGQEWSGQNSGEKGQSKKRKRNHYRQQRKRMAREAREAWQHRFHKQPRLSHAGSFAHSAYNARPGIRDHRFSGIRGGPARYCGPYYRSQPRPAYRPDDATDRPN